MTNSIYYLHSSITPAQQEAYMRHKRFMERFWKAKTKIVLTRVPPTLKELR